MKSAKIVCLSLFLLGLFVNQLLLSQNVWILNNGDPDYQNPPFNDSLKVFQSDGTFLMSKGDFNICQTISGTRRVITSYDGQSCWVSSFVNDSLLKIDIQGNSVLEINRNIGAIDLEESGLIYSLTESGTIYGDSIIVLDEQGNYIMGEYFGGIDIAVDNENSSVWIVGADIKRLNLNLEHHFTIDPIEWVATSVDYTSDGTAWIGEGLHSNVPGSQNKLLHIDQNGSIIDSINLTSRPMCVRVDRRDNTVWFISNALYKYIPNLSQLNVIDNISGFTLSIDQQNDLIWVATYSDVRSYSGEGLLQTVLTNFNGNDQKYVSTPKYNSTSIGEDQTYIPSSLILEQNYPNPFNPTTTIPFSISDASNILIEVFNIKGQKIKTLANKEYSSGNHSVCWNGNDESGSTVSSGIYFYKLKVNNDATEAVKKCFLLK